MNMSDDEKELIMCWINKHLLSYPDDKEICDSIWKFVNR